MYIGRFAPSPTGPLHFGSLLAALASFLRARQQGGRWLVRLEDIDPLRQPPDSCEKILVALEAHGLEWDGVPSFQSNHSAFYDAAIAHLRQSGVLYPCVCSRKQIKESGAREELAGLGPVYPGTCREAPPKALKRYALRMRVGQAELTFNDLIQGQVSQDLERQSGDFIIKRRDDLYSYSLAVAVDDARQEITEVIRGADLLQQTPRQIFIMQHLGLEPPAYGHVPVATDSNGQKLSKQSGALPLDNTKPEENLVMAMKMLGMPVSPEVSGAGLHELLDWGVANFRLEALKGIKTQAIDFWL
jgi:glutamyl-Q tRNA(Asp) synthetase